MDKINYVDFTLESNPEISGRIPAEYDQEARKFIDLLTGDLNEFFKYIEEHPDEFDFTANRGIETQKKKLIDLSDYTGEDKKPIIDNLYLRIGIWMAGHDRYKLESESEEWHEFSGIEFSLEGIHRKLTAPKQD